MPNRWKSMQAALLYVQSQDEAVLERSHALLNLLWIFVAVCTPFALIDLVIARSYFMSFLVIITGAIIPAFILARAGRVVAATNWFLLSYSLIVSILAGLGARTTASEAALPVCASLLTFSAFVASLLIRPSAALVMGIINLVLFSIVYALWRAYSMSLIEKPLLITTFLTPVYIQVLFSIVCWLLAKERQQAIQHVKRESKLLSDIVEQLPIGVAVFEAESLKPYWFNQTVEKLIGPLDQQAQARRAVTPQVVEYKDPNAETISDSNILPWEIVKRTGQSFEHPETLSIVHDERGIPISIEEKAVPITGSDSATMTHILYVAVNITPHRKLQQATEQYLEDIRFRMEKERDASQLKSEFLASMSHELRTPLVSIIGHADLMLTDPQPLPDSIAPSVKAIYKSGKHLLSMINNLLDVARLDAGQMRLSVKPMDMRPVVQDVMDSMQIIAREKALSLTCSLPNTPVIAGVDEVRISQVIYNLLTNALKFTERGAVRLQMVIHGDEVQVAVQDTGIGIPVSHQKIIFERFFQVKEDASNRRSGAGLGLAIARELVTLHGGKIWVQSTPERGSTFTFSVPLAAQLTEAPGAMLSKRHGDWANVYPPI